MTPVATAQPLRSSGFRWYLTGWSITMAGSAMSPVALAFGVLALTDSTAWLSAVLLAAMIPRVGMLVVSGGIADRYRRDAVLRVASLGAGISQTAVAVLLLTGPSPALLLAPAAVNGVFQATTTTTFRGVVPQLARGAGVQVANSLLASARNLAQLIGPAAAGLLTASVGGGWAIAVDAASFLVAAGCFARMSLPAVPAPADGHRSMLTDLRRGWTYFRSRPWIWSVTSAFAVFNAINMGVWMVLGPVIAADTIGAAGWGLVLSARGAGALVATVVMVKLVVRRPMVPAMSFMALAAAPLILLGVGVGTVLLAAAAFVAGAAAEFFTVVWSTVWHLHVPERLSSRVGAWDEFGSFAPIPLGQLLAPVLAAGFGNGPVAICGGLVVAMAMLLPLSVPSLRAISIGAANKNAQI